MSNMDLWNKVKTIEPKYTKRAKLNGQDITTFSLQSVIMMATEQFGPFGKGWGYTVVDERFDNGAILVQASTFEDAEGKMIHTQEVKEITHTLLISIWYLSEGEKIECPPQAGHTPYLMGTKYGPKHDGEYYKKTLADGIKKSLSMLGFGADIFLGLNDDAHYMAVLEEERQLKAQSELPERISEFAERVKQMCEMFSKNDIPHSVNSMATNYKNEIMSKCRQLGINNEVYLNKLKQAYENRINELKEKAKG